MVKSINSEKLETKQLIYTAKSLMNSLTFEEYDEEIQSGGQVLLQKKKRISPQTDPEVLKQFFMVIDKLKNIEIKNLSESDLVQIQQLLEKEREITMGNIETLLKSLKIPTVKSTPKPDHTIEQIMESMLKKATTTKTVENTKRKLITNMMAWVGLKLTNKYLLFYTADKIQAICDNIKAKNVKGSVKRNYAREIKNLILHANTIDPDIYKINLINLIPDFKKTTKAEKEPHWPYTNDELKQIFDPAHDYFKSHIDVFWTTLIGLFVGSRTNAAITLQYADIVNVDGIDCLKFQDTHPIKQLKNDASRRTVPIPQQLLDLGFIDWVKRQQSKLNAKPSDFIFPRCQTESGEYNNKFMTRGFIQYIKNIGITANNPHKLDFHSLRKNANQRLEEVGVSETFINDIIGWEGASTRQQSYSNHDLVKIKKQADKLRYDFLQDEFDYWKTVMANM
ncbi:MAG: site-specific integrase [Alphaproteobacteria bacterium]|nr:site-specific integrase [Alphaproteobacteria bacterium]